MLTINIEYQGLRDLQGRFQRLAAGGADEATAAGVRAVTERIYERAQQNARSLFKTSGRIESALKMTFGEAGARSYGSVSIDGVIAITQEFGGRKGFLIPKGGPGEGKKRLEFEGEAGMVVVPYALHPPLQSRSYLRLALEQTRGEIAELFAGPIRTTMRQR
jgi:hypothetical protein